MGAILEDTKLVIILLLTISVVFLSIAVYLLANKLKLTKFENDFMQERLTAKSEMLQKRNSMLQSTENTLARFKSKYDSLVKECDTYKKKLGLA